jgi:formylglycine-generating enzyme required for sulfatase activity
MAEGCLVATMMRPFLLLFAFALAGCASAGPPPAPASAQAFSDCAGCPEMAVIPAGEFLMGSPSTERYRGAETQHRVVFAKPFAVGRFEVTAEEFDLCVKEGGCPFRPEDEGWGRGRRPVIHVSWHDAKAYAAWLAKKTGKPYRLLSEAEWEYAARGGSGAAFAYGPTLSGAQANFDASTSSDLNPKGPNRGRTVPVGSFPANGFGLHDVHGNAWEWVEDCWHDEYAGAPADGSAWLTGSCAGRVLRGGSFEDSVSDLRAAARVASDAFDGTFSDSFRVARDLP